MNLTKVSSKYQIVVPKRIRSFMKIMPGVSVRILPIDENKALIVKKSDDYVKSLSGLGKNAWRNLGGGIRYIKQERLSWR